VLSKLLGVTSLPSVFDMPVAIRFYRDVLGFTVVNSSPEIDAPEGRYFHWAWLRRGDAQLMLNTAYDAGERPPERDFHRWKGHGDTCLYFACSDVDQLFEELEAGGLHPAKPRNAPYGMRQLHVLDPDGYTLCFQHPVRA
jgi:glyoxylase I family protein